jgi:hypothetical protein
MGQTFLGQSDQSAQSDLGQTFPLLLSLICGWIQNEHGRKTNQKIKRNHAEPMRHQFIAEKEHGGLHIRSDAERRQMYPSQSDSVRTVACELSNLTNYFVSLEFQ